MTTDTKAPAPVTAVAVCNRCGWRWIAEERPLGPGPIVALLAHAIDRHFVRLPS